MRSKSAPTFTENARRAQIVECAIETISELGYAKASVRKIAERVGVAMSVVLYHFGNKDELVAAIVAELYRSLIAIMAPAVAGESTAAGKLAAHIRAHTEYIATRRSHQAALMEIGVNYRSSTGQRLDQLGVDPSLLADLASLELDAILQLGVDNGEFRALSPQAMATAIRSAIGGAVAAAAGDPDFDVRAYGEELVVTFELATKHQ